MTLLDDVRCRSCGCTNLEACAAGCFWVQPDLCSKCAGPYEEDDFEPPGVCGSEAAGCVCHDVDCLSCGPCSEAIAERDQELALAGEDLKDEGDNELPFSFEDV